LSVAVKTAGDYRSVKEDTDVIRYDYHLMDDAAWLLASGEMVIVERKALQAAKEPEKKCWLARIFRK
jgi:hypothetical protein